MSDLNRGPGLLGRIGISRRQSRSAAPIDLYIPQEVSPQGRKQRAAKPPGPSTWWVVMFGGLFLIAVTPLNPSFGALFASAVLLMTGLYQIATNRPTWARLISRGEAAHVIGVAIALVVAASLLPTSLVVAPKALTAFPVPAGDQLAALTRGMTDVDSRFAEDTDTMLINAKDVCRNDFASQTPEQEIASIQEHLAFPTGPDLTPAQGRAILDTVRSTFCGEPGERDAAVISELSYSIPGLKALVVSGLELVGLMEEEPAPL